MPWVAGDGWHVVSVSAVEKSGNISEPVDFAFGVGPAALISPGINQRSAKYFDLAATAPKSLVPVGSKARVMWKAAGDQDFTQVTGGLVTGDGSPWDGGLVSRDTSGEVAIPADVVWDIASSQRPPGSPLQPPAVVPVRVDFVDGAGGGACVRWELRHRRPRRWASVFYRPAN